MITKGLIYKLTINDLLMEDDIKKIMLVLVVVAVIVIVGMFGWAISTHNKMVSEEEAIDSAWAQVSNQYQRKVDLIPQLFNLTDSYLNWEASTLSNITALRTQWMDARASGDIEGQMNASYQLDEQLKTIILTVESYPGLDGIVVVDNLMYEITGTENRIATERGRYNLEVEEYNAHIKKFPASWVAERGDFEERTYYSGNEAPPIPAP